MSERQSVQSDVSYQTYASINSQSDTKNRRSSIKEDYLNNSVEKPTKF
jgi:hypothetical protein